MPGKLDPKKRPAVAESVKRTGSAGNGKALPAKSLTGESRCRKCHQVRGQGGSIGPDPSMIGRKASKENLDDSLLTPSKAIADQYATWKVDTDDGQSITGLLVGETETTLTIRDANGKDCQFLVKGDGEEEAAHQPDAGRPDRRVHRGRAGGCGRVPDDAEDAVADAG